jgi:xanthine dehydrogenase accessory factor
MNRDLLATAVLWRAQGRPAVVVHVLEHRGSVPREAGTRMLVAADAVAGTIGGGRLEHEAIADARRLLREGGMPHEVSVALGPSLGQCCGGAVRLRHTLLQADDPAAWSPAPPRFTLQLYGAGHVGRAVAKLLADLPCRVSWIDEREDQFPLWPLPPHIERTCAEPVEAEIAHATPGSFCLVATHSHALDMAIAQAVLRRGDFAWFGLIGSKTKRAKFEHRLVERGFAQEQLDRIVCPIGLPGIVGKEPEVIALAVVAQMMQEALRQAQGERVSKGAVVDQAASNSRTGRTSTLP